MMIDREQNKLVSILVPILLSKCRITNGQKENVIRYLNKLHNDDSTDGKDKSQLNYLLMDIDRKLRSEQELKRWVDLHNWNLLSVACLKTIISNFDTRTPYVDETVNEAILNRLDKIELQMSRCDEKYMKIGADMCTGINIIKENTQEK